jgi:hypothetical protein
VTEPLAPEPQSSEPPTRLVEAVLDNLPAWTVVALLIGVLYLVWATFEILARYVGNIPSVGA